MELSIEGLTYSYREGFYRRKKRVINDFSMKINTNQSIGLYGKNGCGKTTLLEIIAGIRRIQKGKIIRPKNAKIGYVPERPYYYSEMRGIDFLRYLGKLSGIIEPDLSTKILSLSKIFGILPSLNEKLNSYSKGMLQKIGIIQAVLHDPEIIILDEPTSGLDQASQDLTLDLIKNHFQKNKILIVSSHDRSELSRLCETVVSL